MANDTASAVLTLVRLNERLEQLEALDLENSINSTNSLLVLSSAALVFFMHCGFCMLSVGAVREKNAKNIILKILLDACFAAIAFYTVGFAFAWGEECGFTDECKAAHNCECHDANSFIGYKYFALVKYSRVGGSGWIFWFFQYAFAATAATIVSGAVAERARFEAYLIYSVFLTAWVYPVIVHWIWSSTGWLSALRVDKDLLFGTGAVDFAGCGPVHMIGGFAGLAGAYILGPRIGRFDVNGKPRPMPGHSASLACLGVFILWFGWYGFNPGSALTIVKNEQIVSNAAVSTTLGGASACIATLFIAMFDIYIQTGKQVWDLLLTGNGALAGLVAVTGGCAVYEPWAAIIVGIIGAFVYYYASKFILEVLKIDDPLEASAVHAFTGMWGLLAPGFFADKELMLAVYGPNRNPDNYGCFVGGSGKLLGANIVALLVIATWTLGLMIPFFLMLKSFGLLRVNMKEEQEGLDVSHHNGEAYPKASLLDNAEYPTKVKITKNQEEEP